ncbi:AraC family transcriptional regulator [Chryseobacterium sp. KACC 21268]|nr:AraC family transcriptional regulator [Chryseobacterium sp. KACC 21268]
MKDYFIVILFLISGFAFSKDKDPKSYDFLRTKYEAFDEGDSRAFLYLKPYIKKAKSENKQDQLFQAYKDAVFYTKSVSGKLQYADSCIDAAYKTKNDDMISSSYVLRGSVYYTKLKKFKPALDEYLMAYKYSKNSSDLYLKSKISYHLGVVKNYLGYSEEALELFKNCIRFFEKEANIPTADNENRIYNNQKGYLNSIHQMIVCYRHLKDAKKADSLTDIGLLKTFNNKDFVQERSYFLKSKGISEYNNNKYKAAIDNLDQSLSLMKDDFAWSSIDYFYKGKSYLALNKEELAISNFKKIDSIFNKQEFILPELRENYEILINHYKKQKDSEKQLYYTTQLLKADSIISRDFAYLSLKVHREYDTNTLIEEKGRLETANTWGVFLILSLVTTAGILTYVLVKRHKNDKSTLDKYLALQEKLSTKNYVSSDNSNAYTPVAMQENSEDKKTHITEAVKQDLLQKLRKFEDKKQFTQKGLTIQKLSVQFETNSNYLSHVINEQKGMNFNRYLGDLRIRYITRLLFEKNIYLNYTIDSLAKECGIASRQNFSDLFFEINGIRPTDFIRKRKKELDSLNYSSSSISNIRGLFSEN